MTSHIDYYLLSIVFFIVFLALIVYKDRKKFKRESILLLRRTKRGKKLLISLGTSSPTFLKILGNIGVVIGFAASVYLIFILLYSVYSGITLILEGKGAPQAAGIVLPSLSSTPTAQAIPGVFLIPFWYWVISIAILVVVHEGFHGIFAAREKVGIKSMGVGLLLIIPLAFVEPDENKVKKKPLMSQLRIFAAGSFANFITAFVIATAFLPIMSGFYEQAGVLVEPIKDFPAAEANLTGVITEINGIQIKNITDLSSALSDIKPGDKVEIKTRTFSEKDEIHTYVIEAVERPKEIPGNTTGFIGIQYNPNIPAFNIVKSELSEYSQIIEFLTGLFVFAFILNLGIGIFNLLPLGPFDGGRMWYAVLTRIAPKKGKTIFKIITALSIVLVVATLAIQFV